MPRPSLNPDRAKQGGGGVEAGNYAVTAAKFQNIKTDYKANQLHLVLECAVLDKDGDEVRGADPVEMYFSFGRQSLEMFHPGQADSADSEPEDQGTGVDVEGNTIYCDEEGAQFNKSCGAIVFNETLVKQGFPKATLDRCWAPDFVGLKFALDTRTAKEVNDQYGTRLSTKPIKSDDPKQDGGTVTYKVATKWLNPNYLSGGKEGKAKAGKADAHSNGNADAGKMTDPEEISKHVLGLVAKSRAGEKQKVKTKQQLVGFFTNAFVTSKQDNKNDMLKKCQALVKDDDWLTDALAELGASYVEGVTTFPDAE